MKKLTPVAKRRLIQWILAPITIITIGLGWKYPILGFFVPLTMLAGIIGSLFNGRWVCGHMCPRGSFFDRILSKISPVRTVPAFVRTMKFRWPIFGLLMGFMSFRIMQNPGSWQHWGYVFWVMCVVTTAIAIVLGVIVHPRIWCSFCPMGTMQNAIGGGKNLLRINGDICKMCKTCEKACPIGIPIVSYKNDGVVRDRDCLKCPECLAVCPKKALSWNQ
ncbi:MAG TPA: 4Fe-4S binding protein [bacterium]|nr:4Fe-4S binding protein [bacterium]